jgi:hypothetical protein
MLLGVFLAAPVGCGDNPRSIDAGDDHPSPNDLADAASSPACPAVTGPIDPSALIDDFEDGDAAIAPLAGRTGSWYAEGDSTANAVIDPAGTAAPETIPGGRCGSTRALHVKGSGFADWGSEVSAPLRYGTNDAGVAGYLPWNGGDYQGVTFFARVDDGASARVWIGFSDERARPEAGICVDGGPAGQGCYDAFGADLQQLSTEWRMYRIAFADLSQRHFGVAGSALDRSNLYDIEFVFPARVNFGFWVDDIQLY